jgi:hypothetical protein
VADAQDFSGILRRLRALKEKSQKQAALEELLRREGAETLVRLLQQLLEKSRDAGRNDDHNILLVIAALVLGLPDEMKGAMEARAREMECVEAAGFLSSPPQTLPRTAAPGSVLKGRSGKPLSLGERKSFARSPQRYLLTRLLGDPSPDVIRNLLASPRVTEKDVVRIASRRPTTPAILGVIFDSRRWIASYRVKVALIANPYLPPEVGIKLVPALLRQDLRALAGDNLIHPDVRQAMREMLARRPPEPAGGDALWPDAAEDLN